MAREIEQQGACTASVVCRPRADNWGLVALLVLVGAGWIALPVIVPAPTAPDSGTWWGVGFMASVALIPAVVLAVWLLRAIVVEDGEGLRWRGLRGWRRAEWNQVSDYHEVVLHGRHASGMLLRIETSAGTLRVSDAFWRVGSLREVVAGRATQARARSWGVKGTRPEDDWPRTFDYLSFANRRGPALFTYGGLAFAGVYVGWPAARILRHAGQPGWVWGLAALGLWLGVWLCLGILFTVMLRPILRARRRFGQSITVDLQGLAFHGDDTRFRAPWSEVTDYYIAGDAGLGDAATTFVVVTRQGSMDFTIALREWRLLQQIIRRYATQAAARDWRYRGADTDSLLAPAEEWSGGAVGYGRRVFHYRTRTNRALLCLLGALAASLMLGLALDRLGLRHHDQGTSAVLAGVLGACFSWVYACYRWTTIVVDDTGISHRGVLRRRSLPWGEIHEYRMVSEDAARHGLVAGPGVRIRFWFTVSGVGELRDEIAGRAFNARVRGWEMQ